MQWDISKRNVQLPGFSSPAVFNLIDLVSEVQESLHCRICDRSVSANNWAWQRLESKAHAILNPDGIVQLGVKFRCIFCKAIHLAVPLPCHQGRGDGSVWACGDPAVDLVMRSLPSRNGFISKAVGRSRDITIKEAFDAGTTAAAAAMTAVKGVSSATWTRPAPWVLYDRRGRSDQASNFEAAVPTDTLLTSASASAATAPRAGACGNYANGSTAAATSAGDTASATPISAKATRTPSAAAGLPAEERYLLTIAPFTRKEQARRNRCRMLQPLWRQLKLCPSPHSLYCGWGRV